MSSERMIGVSFGACQGWFHPASGNRAVLVCSGHGFEELCARSTLMRLADQLAQAGMPVLRFDYPGTANAAGGEGDPNLVADWRQSIKDAALWLKAREGVQDIIVIGFRLGAMLAALEAEAVEGISALALLAPVVSGRQYTRETAILSKIMDTMPSYAVDEQGCCAIDVCGFCTSAETEADLKGLSLHEFRPAKPMPILLMEQRGAKQDKLASSLEAAGCVTTRVPFHGYEELICDPTASRVPTGAIDTVVSWVREIGIGAIGTEPEVAATALVAPDWSEQGVTFGAGGRLAGIVCMPQKRIRNSPPVIFINSGMNYHIGWGRSSVRQARALAEAGIMSLRYDLPGIGDSIDESPTGKLPLYDERAEQGLTMAIDWLIEQGYGAPLLFGACSGGYTAFHVARKDARIEKVLVANLQCFHWTVETGFAVERWRDMRRAEISAAHVRAADARAGSGAGRALSVCKAATGFVRKVLAGSKRRIRDKLVPKKMADDGRVLGWIKDMSARRCELAFVYARGEAGAAMLEAHTGLAVGAPNSFRGVSIHTLENCDHSITPRAAQDELVQLIRQLAAISPVGGEQTASVAAAAGNATPATSGGAGIEEPASLPFSSTATATCRHTGMA